MAFKLIWIVHAFPSIMDCDSIIPSSSPLTCFLTFLTFKIWFVSTLGQGSVCFSLMEICQALWTLLHCINMNSNHRFSRPEIKPPTHISYSPFWNEKWEPVDVSSLIMYCTWHFLAARNLGIFPAVLRTVARVTGLGQVYVPARWSKDREPVSPSGRSSWDRKCKCHMSLACSSQVCQALVEAALQK